MMGLNHLCSPELQDCPLSSSFKSLLPKKHCCYTNFLFLKHKTKDWSKDTGTSFISLKLITENLNTADKTHPQTHTQKTHTFKYTDGERKANSDRKHHLYYHYTFYWSHHAHLFLHQRQKFLHVYFDGGRPQCSYFLLPLYSCSRHSQEEQDS